MKDYTSAKADWEKIFYSEYYYHEPECAWPKTVDREYRHDCNCRYSDHYREAIETLLKEEREKARQEVVEEYEKALEKSIPHALLTYEEYWNLTHEEAHEAAEPFMEELIFWIDKYLPKKGEGK